MSRMDGNVIDLTEDSDEERKVSRADSTVQSTVTNGRLVPRSNPVSLDRRNHIPPPFLNHRVSDSYRRQYPPPRPYFGPERRPHAPPSGIHSIPNFSGRQDHVKSKGFENGLASNPRPGIITPPSYTGPKKNTCNNCAEIGVTCDGERPCSACVEPGLSCYYPGEKPTVHTVPNLPVSAPKSISVVLLVQRGITSLSQDIAARLKSTSLKTLDLTQQSDLIPNALLSATNPIHDASESRTQIEQEDSFYDSDDSDDDDLPLAIADFEEVKRLLKRHEVRMREHRAYLLQPLLNQSKVDATRSSAPTTTAKTSPFQKLTTKAKMSSASGSNRSSALMMQVKSHKVSTSKKWSQLSIPMKVIATDPTILPKYKSIGRLGNSLLAPNIRTLKYWPYFADEESLDASEAKKNEELEERYQHDDNHLLAQRKCSELVDMWRPWVKDFLSKLRIESSDVLYWFLNTTEKTTCDTCEQDILAEAFSEISQLIHKPSERSLTLARLSAMAVRDVAKVSMWHFVLGASSVKELVTQLEPPKKSTAMLCSVCFLHNCLSHGAYLEPEESGGAVIMGGDVEINDEELSHNIRLSTGIPNKIYADEHQCGLYCVAAESRIKAILGRSKEGTISGIYNNAVHVSRLSIGNTTDCSEQCYWPIERRTKFGHVHQTKGYEPKISEKSKELFKLLLRIHSDNQRAPCMLAKEINGLACMDAFYYMLAETHRNSHFRRAAANAVHQGTRKISKLAAGLDTSLSADLDERPPFVPCSHSGPCLSNPECSCAQNKIHCEWFCGCDKSCDRRFPGCKCASVNKTCFSDKNCECWKHNRECDPWLCGNCGVIEVLDPQNKYKDEVRKGRCKNNRIQLELPARTIKAPSEVQGWGLYAGADLEENAFIGEYKGETVGNQESDRRGAVYANIGQEYLFVMNRDQQIDGSNFGNKTRFINNSQRDDYINVFAKKLLCNGVQRVMLYSRRSIKAGEELLYNYNYPVSVTKKFWERGEGPTNVPGAVVAKPSISWSQPRVDGRFARIAGKQDGERSPNIRVQNEKSSMEDDEVMARREVKRKRASDLMVDLISGNTAETAAFKIGVDRGLMRTNGMLFPDDLADSDFELVDASETSESMKETETDSDQGEALTTDRPSRRSVLLPDDRRRGGLAQAKAWETRRKRAGKGK